MELENQVCSLELAKRLKELGVKQESIFCYQAVENSNSVVHPRNFNLHKFRSPSKDERIAAFTVAELGEMLPNQIELLINETKEGCGIFRPTLWCGRCEFNSEGLFEWMICYGDNLSKIDKNEANARAKMLIYLIENGFVKV